MPTIESPVVSDWPVPATGFETYGQFVIVSFDPVASVAVFEDVESTEVASTRPRVKHLALVTSMGRMSPMNDDGHHPLTLEFQLLGLGLHTDEDATGRTSIPVAPETSHPLNRAPIVPCIPLPWPGFYLYTLFKVASLVSRVHYEPDQPYPYITLDQRRDIFMLSLKDQQESDLRQQPAEAPISLDFGNDSEYDSIEGSVSAESSEEEESHGRADDNPELTALLSKTDDVHPYAEVWTDLSYVAHPGLFGKPIDILPQLDWLKEMTADYERRALSKLLSKPETGDWVRSVGKLVLVPVVAHSSVQTGNIGLSEAQTSTAGSPAREDACAGPGSHPSAFKLPSTGPRRVRTRIVTALLGLVRIVRGALTTRSQFNNQKA